jgi:stearoyl-CoA desaturase (delta-9 desaturase)
MKLMENHNETVFVTRNFITVLIVHAIVLSVAPFLFTWNAFFFALGTGFVFGVPMGIFHHMMLTHKSFKSVRWIEYMGSLLGTLTWRGPFAGPVRYVAMHRVHHAFSDTEFDPHTPDKGIWHAWLGWFWRMPKGFTQPVYYDRYAKDIAKDPWHRFLDRNVDLLQGVWGLLCFIGGGLWPVLSGGSFDAENALRYAIYGVFVRTILTWYLINVVDVLNHRLGYRNYETGDKSTNSLLMGAFHWGGAISWHNNHHAHPRYFSVKKQWWEFDVYLVILRLGERMGLISDIHVLDESATQPIAVGALDVPEEEASTRMKTAH